MITIEPRDWVKNLVSKLKRDLGINTPGWTEYFAFGGGSATITGARISERNALNLSTVYQCVKVISDTVASLPFFTYRRLDRGKDRATDHPVYRILHERPNEYMAPFEFKQALQGHLCLWGNAYAEIERNGGGKVINLWPLRPDSMRVEVLNGVLWYFYITPDGIERQLRADQVYHLRGLSSDGIMGYSPIAVQRETLGVSKASQEYRARFFSNDARPGGWLEHPSTLTEAAQGRLRKQWETAHGGLSNVNRVAILEEGLKWHDVGFPPDQAQFIQGEEFGKADIAGIFRVPSYKIGLLKPGTVSFASVEQQAIDFVIDCIRPWLVCWEQRTTLALLTETERRSLFTEFLIDALLRGDSAARAAYYTALFNIGALSQNDILEKENMNGIGALGDRHYVPLNVVPVDRLDDLLDAKIEPQPEPAQPMNGNGAVNGAAHNGK